MAKILIIDDDTDIRTLCKTLLYSSGHTTVLADGVKTALKHLGKTRFDLIILDVSMPGHSGFDFLKTVNNDPEWPGTPIVMFTAKKERDFIERALSLGVKDYILKPLQSHTFLPKIEKWLHVFTQSDGEVFEFPKNDKRNEVRITLTAKLILLSPKSMTILSPHPVKLERAFYFRSQFLFSFGIPQIEVKPHTCEKCDDGYEVRLMITEPDADIENRIEVAITELKKQAQGKTA